MGHDEDLFLDGPVDDEFKCSLCLGILKAATTGCADGHTFCADCLRQVRGGKCGVCRGPALATPLLNRPLNNMIAKLRVRCPHASGAAADDGTQPRRTRQRTGSKAGGKAAVKKAKGGCEWEGVVDGLDAHLAACPFITLPCPLGCGASASASEMDAHKAVCGHRPIVCGDCGKSIPVPRRARPNSNDSPRDRALRHHQQYCADKILPCPCCQQQMPRKDLGTGGSSYYPRGECTCTAQNDSSGTKCSAGHHYTGHYRVCPELKLTCDFGDMGCKAVFPRKDREEHNKDHAHTHAELLKQHTEKRLKAIETAARESAEWQSVRLDWEVPCAKLTGSAVAVVKSKSFRPSGTNQPMYLALELAAQGDPVKVRVYAEEPDWTPVVIKDLTLKIDVDSAANKLKIQSTTDYDDYIRLKVDGSLDLNKRDGRDVFCASKIPIVRGTKQYQADDVEVTGEADDSEDDGEYEEGDWYDHLEADLSRADLCHVFAAEELTVTATFKLEKLSKLSVGCR